MNTLKTAFLILPLMFCALQAKPQSRLLNKIKEKAEDKLVEEIFDKDNYKNNKDEESNGNDNYSDNSSSSSSVKNSRGEGLSASSINVEDQIDEAVSSLKSSEYSDASMAIRLAIQGIELQIGQEVLTALPADINGLNANKDNDKVTSTGIGFVGMTIEREYSKNDQLLEVIIANNSVWISSVNMYLTNTAYVNQDEEGQYKQIKFQDNRGIIEYDDNAGYKLSVPFGQSSILIINGVNFGTENEFMDACNRIIIKEIMVKLGEQ